MSKKKGRGRRSRQRFLARIRRKNDMIIKAPWGKELLVEEGGRTLLPPPGFRYWSNQWGRGFYVPLTGPTRYDKLLPPGYQSKEIPEWVKRLKPLKGLPLPPKR